MFTRFKTKLSKKTRLTEDVFLLKFDLIEPKEIVFLAGQYIISLIPQGQPNQFLRRLYSIASSPDMKNSFELMIKVFPNGIGSTYLTSLSQGNVMFFDGPAGMFTLKENSNKKVFLATGTGLAPIRAMLKSKTHIKNKKYYLFWGLRKLSDVCLFEELKLLIPSLSTPNFKICLSRETSLDQIPEIDRKYYSLGRIPTVLDQYWQEIKDGEFNICGNRELVETLKTYLYEKMEDKSKIYFEKF